MDSSLTPLIDAFRQRYPDASFTAELIAVEAGQFVVRSHIHLSNNIHISALAADLTLETAEDRACLRALQKLGLQPNLTATPEPQPIAKAVPTQPQAPVPLHRPSVIATAEVPAPQPKPIIAVDPPFPLFEADLDEDNSSPEVPEAQAQPTAAASPSLPQAMPAPVTPVVPVVEPSLFDSPLTEPADSSPVQAEPARPPQSATVPQLDLQGSGNPIDLSDIIAQTDVELRRLGWTVGQGREFLEKTYGKRSRHDLTDEELLEFLLYLESQTAAMEG